MAWYIQSRHATYEEKSAMSETTNPSALLIIDAQVGLMGADDPDCRAALERIAALAERARAASAPVIYMQHDGGPQHPLNPAAPGWPISPLVAPQPSEPVLRKTASDSFYETPLQRELDARSVRRLVVAVPGARGRLGSRWLRRVAPGPRA